MLIGINIESPALRSTRNKRTCASCENSIFGRLHKFCAIIVEETSVRDGTDSTGSRLAGRFQRRWTGRACETDVRTERVLSGPGFKHPLPTATGQQAGDLPEWARLVWRHVADGEEGSSAGGQHAAAVGHSAVRVWCRQCSPRRCSDIRWM